MKITTKLLNKIYKDENIQVSESITEQEELNYPDRRVKDYGKKVFRKVVKERAEELAALRGHKRVLKKDLKDAVDLFKNSSVYNPNIDPLSASDYAFRKAIKESGLPIRFKDARGRFMSIFDKAIIIEYQGSGTDEVGNYRQYMLHTDYYYYVVREYESDAEGFGFGAYFELIEQGPIFAF